MCIRTCVHAYACACVRVCMRTYVHAYVCACVLVCMRTCVHACVCACVRVCEHDTRVSQMDPRLRAAQLAIKRKQEEAVREKQANILKKCSLFI